MIRNILVIGAAAVCLVSVCGLSGAEPAAKTSWPEFHGPKRDNISPATGLLKQWPKGGPKLVWQSDQCGGGYAGVSIADGMIFTSGDFGRQEMVLALDLDGRLLWKSPNGRSWTGPHPGARTTPTYHTRSSWTGASTSATGTNCGLTTSAPSSPPAAANRLVDRPKRGPWVL